MRRRHLVPGALALAVTAVVAGATPSAARAPVSKPLHATLTGAAERPDRGDTDATGAAIVVPTSATTLCYALVVHAMAKPAAAHIHQGAAGVAGDVVVTLKHPAKGNNGFSSGCVTAPRDTIAAIRRNPSRYYVNVHNAEFPGGAARGQLSAR